MIVSGKQMTSNHGEYSKYITLENLKGSVQIYWGFTHLCRKSNEGTWGT